MKQEIYRILITAIVSACIAVLQAYLTAITKVPVPAPNAVVAGLYGAVIAGTKAITSSC